MKKKKSKERNREKKNVLSARDKQKTTAGEQNSLKKRNPLIDKVTKQGHVQDMSHKAKEMQNELQSASV